MTAPLRLVKAATVSASGAGTAVDEAEAARRRTEELAAEKERQDALAAAYAAGFDAGREAAGADGAAAALRGAAALERLEQRVAAHTATQEGRTLTALVDCAFEIASWALRGTADPEVRGLLTRLEEAAAALLPSPTTRVRVAPADLAAVTSWATHRVGTEVVADTGLAPGDALLETDGGSVDVTLAAALRVAAAALDAHAPGGAS